MPSSPRSQAPTTGPRSAELVATLSRRLLALPGEAFDRALQSILGEMGQLAKVQRTYVFLLSDDGKQIENTHEWCAAGVPAHDRASWKGMALDGLAWTTSRLLTGKPLVVDHPRTLPPEAVLERAAAEAAGIRQYVQLPLFLEDSLVGWLGFESTESRPAWTPEELRLMGIAGNMIVEAVVRRQREEVLVQQRELGQRLAAVGSLAAWLAHEINNPLAYVQSNVELAQELLGEGTVDESGAAKIREALKLSAKGVAQLRRMVQDVSAFTQATSLELEPVDLQEVLDTALRMTNRRIRHRAQLVRTYQDAPAVRATTSQLGQVFLNLIVNAVHALPEGHQSEHTIRVAAHAIDEQLAVVEIEDDGCGIRPEVLPRIFDPYFTTREESGGVGVGLAICNNIVRGFGGTIEVDTELGVGTTVTVVLPRASEPAADTDPPAHSLAAGRRRVLIVDDEPRLLHTFRRVLGTHDVTTAPSGNEAITLLATDADFDLVVCDVHMHEGTGMDVHAFVEEHQPELLERMVFVSGGTSSDQAEAFFERSGARQLVKPVSNTELRALALEMRPRRDRSA